MRVAANVMGGCGTGLTRWIYAFFVLVLMTASWGATAAVAQVFQEPWQEEGGYAAPSQPEQKVQGNTVYIGIQTSTEIQTATGVPPAASTVSAGLDAYIGDKRQTYALPLAYNITPAWGVEGVVPFVVMNHKDHGDWTTDKALGDIVLTAKNRAQLGGYELQSIVSAKLANGNEEKELGTGAYDFSLTEKLVVSLHPFRLTCMLGYTYRGDDAHIDGNRVDYGDGFSWMTAADANVWSPALWLGLRATGLVQGDTEVEGKAQDDRLVTVDLAPEVKYFVTDNSAVTLGVFVPVFTKYDVKGDDPRELTMNVGFFSLF